MTRNRPRTWQDNAAEFAALDRGEGWQFAILVACSVEKTPAGVRRGSGFDRNGKALAEDFATEAGTSRARVHRYFDAWQEAAAKGWVQDATTLAPSDAHDLTIPGYPWRAKDGGVYDASKTGGQISNVDQIAAKAAKDPEYARRVVTEVAKANVPGAQRGIADAIKGQVQIAGAADAALDERYEEQKATLPSPKIRERGKNERFIDAVSAARGASRKIKDFADAVAGGDWTDDEREAFALQIEQLAAALDMVRAGINTGSWDAELEKLLSGGAA